MSEKIKIKDIEIEKEILIKVMKRLISKRQMNMLKIINCLKEEPMMTIRDMSKKLDLASTTIYENINQIKGMFRLEFKVEDQEQ